MIYYSHVNEDNRVERRLLTEGSFTDLWCIAGSGERLIALLDAPRLQRVYAVDSNPEALYLLEAKLAGLRALTVAEYLALVGFDAAPPAARLSYYQRLRDSLSAPCRDYWDQRPEAIRRGLLHVGHFERFLHRIRPWLRAYLGKHFFSSVLGSPTPKSSFPHRRWALLMRLFRYRWVYRLLGSRDPAFVAADADRRLIPAALQRTLDRGTADQSFMFHFIFRGHLRDMASDQLPPSVQPSVLTAIQHRLRNGELRIHYRSGDLLTVWEAESQHPQGPLFFSLSDLLSFVEFSYIQDFCQAVGRRTDHPALFVLRAFLRNHLPDRERDWLQQHFTTVKDLSPAERTAMYRIYAYTHEPSLLPHPSLPA